MTFRKCFCDIPGLNSSLSKLTSFLILTGWKWRTELVYTLVSCTDVFILPWNSKHGFAEKVIRLQIFRPPLFVKQTLVSIKPLFEPYLVLNGRVMEKQSIYGMVWTPTMSKIAVSVNLRRLAAILARDVVRTFYKCNYFPGKYNFLI